MLPHDLLLKFIDLMCPKCGQKFVQKDRFGVYCTFRNCDWKQDNSPKWPEGPHIEDEIGDTRKKKKSKPKKSPRGRISPRERLAGLIHEVWSDWMKYLFSVSQHNKDGSITITSAKVVQWTRQLNTPYEDLSEKEKDSDRKQADKILKEVL